jgi:hypothetical protein
LQPIPGGLFESALGNQIVRLLRLPLNFFGTPAILSGMEELPSAGHTNTLEAAKHDLSRSASPARVAS